MGAVSPPNSRSFGTRDPAVVFTEGERDYGGKKLDAVIGGGDVSAYSDLRQFCNIGRHGQGNSLATTCMRRKKLKEG